MATTHATSYDVLIIGAGVAGCALARAFGRQGRRVLVIERSLAEPDRIVGELLQPGGVKGLEHLGLEECLEGIEATPVRGYHLYWRDEETSFWFCPEIFADGTGRTRVREHTGRSFHHGRFVAKLRAAIEEDNTDVTLIETSAREIIRDDNTGRVIGAKCSKGNSGLFTEYLADLVILADGANSNFRSQFSPSKPKSQSRFWGLELSGVHLPMPYYAYGVLGSGPPLLVYRIGNGETRILIDIFDDVYAKLDGQDAVRSHISERVLPSLPQWLQPGLRDALRGGRLRSMPNSWMPSTPDTVPGLVMLGDAANMRHPMTGAGMTVAIKDAILLADLLKPEAILSLRDSNAVLKKLGEFHWKRKYHSTALNILAQCLYLLFASEARALGIMQRGFITFVQGGEENFGGAVGLMGVLGYICGVFAHRSSRER